MLGTGEMRLACGEPPLFPDIRNSGVIPAAKSNRAAQDGGIRCVYIVGLAWHLASRVAVALRNPQAGSRLEMSVEGGMVELAGPIRQQIWSGCCHDINSFRR
jgi:hypothetical protein